MARGGVQPGDPLAEAIYAVTDAIPFYELGSVVQTIEGVCSDETGCAVPDEAEPPASSPDEPSDGADASWSQGASGGEARLVSRVELRVSRLFGLPPASSVMTTRSSLPHPVRSSRAGVLETEVRVQTTSAERSSIAALLPPLDALLSNFPSGDALEMASKGSSAVTMRTTYLSEGLRITRPVLNVGGAEDASAVFVFAREDVADVASGAPNSVEVREG